MSQALLIVSILASLNVLIGSSIKAINERIDVAVFFKETVTEEQATGLRDVVKTYPGVEDVLYVSSQDALDKFLAENRNRTAIREVISEEENFLPASLEIKAGNPYLIEGIVEQVRSSEGGGLISETSLEDNQQMIERLRSVGRLVQRSSMLLALVLMAIALMIVFNTIRITIFSRRTEIEIMRLVGATDWYIRWPFVIEGMIYGVVATAVTSGILFAGYHLIIRPVMGQYLFASTTNSVFSFGFMMFLIVLQLIVGLIIGAMSSYMATKKHLTI